MADDLRDELRIGMPYEELVRLLGEPSDVTEGAELLGGRGRVMATDQTTGRLHRTRFCYWRRPEAAYYLVVADCRLAGIESIVQSVPNQAPI